MFRSGDGGETWTSVRTFNNFIMKINASVADSRKLYVSTKGAGVWRSDDGGLNWIDLSKNYEKMGGAKDFYDVAFGVSDPNLIILATKFGLIRSFDSGEHWEKVNILTPPGSTTIYSLAVDPKEPNNIYYGTSTTFYRTSNGGINWVTKKLPTSRVATVMHVDRSNSNVLYMGVTRFKK
jgi:photosystem II stability/assembly factor-like uncharacterized protein